jgi:hypothetical protein
MYEFGNFGDDILAQNNPVTFTYATNKVVDFQWPSTVEAKIRADMAPYGNVLKVDRGLFSGRYTITIVPQQDMAPSVWQDVLLNSFKAAGYPSASFVAMEGGTISTVSGGASEAISVSTKKIGTDIVKPVVGGVVNIAESALAPLTPFLLIGAAGLGLYLYLQYKSARRVI